MSGDDEASPARVRSPRWERLDAGAADGALAALRLLRGCGIEQLGSVDAAIDELAAKRAAAGETLPPPAAAAKPQADDASSDISEETIAASDDAAVDALVSSLRAHLRQCGGGLYKGVYRWLRGEEWFWRTVNEEGDTLICDGSDAKIEEEEGSAPAAETAAPEAPPAKPPEDNPFTDGDEEAEAAKEAEQRLGMVRELAQAVNLLQNVLSRYAQGSEGPAASTTTITLSVCNEDTLGFGPIVDTFKALTCTDESMGKLVSYIQFPTRGKRDSYKCMNTKKRVLMQATVKVHREESFYTSKREFELLINLMGECHFRDGNDKATYNAWHVITAQGQRTKLAGKSAATDGTKVDEVTGARNAVVRCMKQQQAIHSFKVALVRAVEHTIHHVIHSDFLSEITPKEEEPGDVATPKGHLATRQATGSFVLKKRKSVAMPDHCGLTRTVSGNDANGNGDQLAISCQLPNRRLSATPITKDLPSGGAEPTATVPPLAG